MILMFINKIMVKKKKQNQCLSFEPKKQDIFFFKFCHIAIVNVLIFKKVFSNAFLYSFYNEKGQRIEEKNCLKCFDRGVIKFMPEILRILIMLDYLLIKMTEVDFNLLLIFCIHLRPGNNVNIIFIKYMEHILRSNKK